ncbi:MAG: hypothetical protein ABL956_13760, partial [Hyphomonadaceae bacterium]
MTSATDFSPIIPPVRLDSATPRAASSKEEGPSFADVLETETTATESEEDLVSAYTGPPGAQPSRPPATPAVNSPEAFLAGLTLDAPATQAIDAAKTTDAPSVPAPPPATPAVNSPEAFLAGLTLDAPATQAIDAAKT